MGEILFAAGVPVDPPMSQHTRDTLTHALDNSGNPSCVVTCRGRDAAHQARAMHDNCILHGTAAQYATYSRHDAQGNVIEQLPGCRVIDVFVADVHKSAADTIADMTAKILEIGPSLVSKHCGDQTKLEVQDIAQSSLQNGPAFKAILLSHGSGVSKCLDENGCFHVEVPQPVA